MMYLLPLYVVGTHIDGDYINYGKYIKVIQSFPTLCNPIDYTVHGVFQARILELVAIPFSRASSQPRD